MVGQRCSSTVRPVSVSFDVEGQRTSKLFLVTGEPPLGRRGGANKKRVAISQSRYTIRAFAVS